MMEIVFYTLTKNNMGLKHQVIGIFTIVLIFSIIFGSVYFVFFYTPTEQPDEYESNITVGTNVKQLITDEIVVNPETNKKTNVYNVTIRLQSTTTSNIETTIISNNQTYYINGTETTLQKNKVGNFSSSGDELTITNMTTGETIKIIAHKNGESKIVKEYTVK